MKPTKQGANERRLAKLLREACEPGMMSAGDCEGVATFLARRGVLAVGAKTVDGNFGVEPPQYFRWGDFRAYLRRLARGR